MPGPPTRLVHISFAIQNQTLAVQNQLMNLGYQPAVVGGEDWLRGDARICTGPTVLQLGRQCRYDQIASALAHQKIVPHLGIFSRDKNNWDTELASRCQEFVCWPCHDQELAARLERAGAGAGGAVDDFDEAVLVDEFADLNLVGRSAPFLESLKLIKKFARCDAPVLIQGETGTGKELAARAIHYLSVRRDEPFVPVNCGAIPDSLMENELFGHEKGAFTDARNTQEGLIAQANGGTLFLDEVETLSARGQVALLRFLQDQRYKPLGARKLSQAKVNVIAATNLDLRSLANQGQFRRDLFFRLDVMSLELPPLRDRTGDVALLATHFIRRYGAQYKKPFRALHPDAASWMQAYRWPGNIRELESLIHRACVLSDGKFIYFPEHVEDPAATQSTTDWLGAFPSEAGFNQAKTQVVAEFEKQYLSRLLIRSHGNITRAAQRAGKERRELGKLLRKHGLDKSR